jgi:serine/threonine-protein kinase
VAAAEPWAPSSPELETLLELGQGGMATAYLARALGAGGFERLVVLKRLSLELRQTEGALERFVAEASVAARLHHANIVGTHQIDHDAAGPYIVLDYVEGGALDELVIEAEERGERLPVPVVLRIAKDVVAGLRAVHEATDTEGRPLRILHRDVSLQNVLVGVRDGVSRVADFGVAKSVLSRARTHPGYVVGKVQYLPPEYLRGDPIGPTLDLYALGVTLFIALTGEEPWPDVDDGELPLAIMRGVPPLATHIEVAPELQEFVSRACEREPGDRFQSAREMNTVLERFERERGWVASHGEVATCVEHLLGKKLQARRELLAKLAPGLAPRPALEGSRTRPAPKPRAATAPLRVASAPRPAEAPPRAAADGARARTLVARAGAVVTLGLLGWLLLRAPAPATSRAASRTTPSAASPPHDPSEWNPVAKSTGPSLPAPLAAAAASQAAAPAPTVASSAPSAPSAAEPVRRPAPAPAPKVTPLSTIKTKNPYR